MAVRLNIIYLESEDEQALLNDVRKLIPDYDFCRHCMRRLNPDGSIADYRESDGVIIYEPFKEISGNRIDVLKVINLESNVVRLKIDIPDYITPPEFDTQVAQ